MHFTATCVNLANICVAAAISQNGANMPDLHNNQAAFLGNEDSDADIFEFDLKLKEITSKINDAMQRVNAHYPEKTNKEPAAEDAG